MRRSRAVTSVPVSHCTRSSRPPVSASGESDGGPTKHPGICGGRIGSIDVGSSVAPATSSPSSSVSVEIIRPGPRGGIGRSRGASRPSDPLPGPSRASRDRRARRRLLRRWRGDGTDRRRGSLRRARRRASGRARRSRRRRDPPGPSGSSRRRRRRRRRARRRLRARELRARARPRRDRAIPSRPARLGRAHD